MNITTCLFGLILLPTVPGVKEVHVSPNGDDSHAGTAHEPVKTLECAQRKLRELNSESRDYSVRIVLHEGRYRLEQPVLFSSSDSAPEAYPTIIESAPGERVVISGAENLVDQGLLNAGPDFDRLPSESKGQVHVYRVPNLDLKSRFENYLRSDETQVLPSPIDLFENGELLPIATFPHRNKWAIVGQDNAMSFNSAKERDALWLHTLATTNDLDQYRRLNLEAYRQLANGDRYQIENSISDLDEPGEWCFNEASSTIYWWPTSTDSELNASAIETLISLYEVENTIIRGICFEGARVQGIEIAGGAHCIVEKCEFRCIGNVGIHVFHGEEHTIKDCFVHSTGSSGIRIEAGDSELDIEAGHQCVNNSIQDCCQKHLCRHAGIAIFGCGVTLEHNSISKLPDWGISLHGSKHQASLNEVQNVCLETTDTGAIYVAGSEYTKRNRIHSNHVYNIGAFDTKNAYAVYLDGTTNNNEITENIIHDVVRAVVVRNGQDNHIVQNAIYNCLIGIQIEQQAEVASNEITSNAIACRNPIVCNHDHSVLAASNNTKEIEQVFENYRTGDFRISSGSNLTNSGFKPLHIPTPVTRKSLPVSTNKSVSTNHGAKPSVGVLWSDVATSKNGVVAIE
ncbi:MAG: right-handed parallel beta-helix repeat-containing protein [Pirellula sp.]|jgi:hypothetical protein